MNVNMKFSDWQARLSIELRDPIAKHVELMRTLREDSRGLVTEERKLAREAAAEGCPPIAWGERGFAGLLRGRSGPGAGSGLETNPTGAGFYLAGYLVESPLHQIALQTLTMSYAHLREVWQQTVEMPQAETRKRTLCPMTRQRLFLPAFAAVLGDAELTAQCVDVGVCSALGIAYLDFVPVDQQGAGPWALPPTKTRCLFVRPDYDVAPSGSYSVSHFYPSLFADLLSLVRPPAPGTRGRASARRPEARARWRESAEQ